MKSNKVKPTKRFSSMAKNLHYDEISGVQGLFRLQEIKHMSMGWMEMMINIFPFYLHKALKEKDAIEFFMWARIANQEAVQDCQRHKAMRLNFLCELGLWIKRTFKTINNKRWRSHLTGLLNRTLRISSKSPLNLQKPLSPLPVCPLNHSM